MKRFGRVDVLVNSAGTTQFVPLSDLEGQKAEDFQKVYAVNVIGPYQMARAAAPHLRASGAGAIVNVSSIGSLNGNGSSYSYVTSKAALNTLTLALARNLAPEIRVNCVLPGLIQTRWLKNGLGDEAYERVRDGWADASALQKTCTAEDVAQAIVWLAVDSPLVTGQLHHRRWRLPARAPDPRVALEDRRCLRCATRHTTATASSAASRSGRRISTRCSARSRRAIRIATRWCWAKSASRTASSTRRSKRSREI